MASKDTGVAALPYVNQFTSTETFFLAGMSPVGFCEVPTGPESPLVGVERNDQHAASRLNENPLKAAGYARCADGGFSGLGCRGARAGRHAAVRSAPGRPARRVFAGARHWPGQPDHASDRTIAGR